MYLLIITQCKKFNTFLSAVNEPSRNKNKNNKYMQSNNNVIIKENLRQ